MPRLSLKHIAKKKRNKKKREKKKKSINSITFYCMLNRMIFTKPNQQYRLMMDGNVRKTSIVNYDSFVFTSFNTAM